MEKYLFLGYSRCSTAKKAQTWLDAQGIEYVYRDLILNPPTEKEIKEWWSKSGLELKRFFNTSGLVYKALDLKTKLPSLKESEMIKLLSSDGKLVKRPVLVAKNFVLVGFKEAVWKEALGIDN